MHRFRWEITNHDQTGTHWHSGMHILIHYAYVQHSGKILRQTHYVLHFSFSFPFGFIDSLACIGCAQYCRILYVYMYAHTLLTEEIIIMYYFKTTKNPSQPPNYVYENRFVKHFLPNEWFNRFSVVNKLKVNDRINVIGTVFVIFLIYHRDIGVWRRC